jgi:hypothetical protein
MERSPRRIGFHYFPDTLHYRAEDLQRWLPELNSLQAAWLTLPACATRSIPESFICALLEAGIHPVLHFHIPIAPPPTPEQLHLLFSNYARWGVRYAALFDRPNTRVAWPVASWSHRHLVERFLDSFLPVAECAVENNITPIFPPLEPGGDYWDTAFLRAALHSLHRRASSRLQNSLALGAYAWAGKHPLDWGQGGPRQWPQARPYLTPTGSQDQQGFRIFEWYAQIAADEFGRPLPIFLLAAGACMEGETDPKEHAATNLAIARTADTLPDYVLACNFWLLSADATSPQARQAWFRPDGNRLPAVAALQAQVGGAKSDSNPRSVQKPIAHYLLLPAYDWGAADWHLEMARPFIKKYRPTTGFSLDEAALAQRVTVIGGESAYPEAALDHLRAQGSQVERISGDGTEVASILSTL